MKLFELIARVIPFDYREQCLGDLYEGYSRLRGRGRSKAFSSAVTSWRILTLVVVGVQMRWEDFQDRRKQKKSISSCTQSTRRNRLERFGFMLFSTLFFLILLFSGKTLPRSSSSFVQRAGAVAASADKGHYYGLTSGSSAAVNGKSSRKSINLTQTVSQSFERSN